MSRTYQMADGKIDSTAAEQLAVDHAVPFDELPDDAKLQCFGVEYAHVKTRDGGDLFLTKFGWPYLQHLMPETWYADRAYAKQGQRLPGGTGSVYRMGIEPTGHRRVDVVIKFSRVGQEVPLEMATSIPDSVPPAEIAQARFNGPFEEFGLTMEMRRGHYGPPGIRLWAQRPLAIYVPAEEFELWRLGRSKGRFRAHQRKLETEQEDEQQKQSHQALELDIKREYVLIYNWIKGFNAEEMLERGAISESQFNALTPRVVHELRAKGYRVLDNKPKHFILRQHHRTDNVLQRHGELAYALVDFELLERTGEHRQHFKATQRSRYWYMQSQRDREPLRPLPAHVKRMQVLDVNYVYTTAPNGGKVWAVGNHPELVDFFMPDRWRRTPRVRLSANNEIYHTRSRDSVHMVYRRSRCGEKPHADPYYEQGRRIRDYGFNTPFEEVAIAEALRQMGIRSVYARAIYRTGHQSSTAAYMRDSRRYEAYKDLLTPDRPHQPILHPDYDYYVIWGYYRGIDPQRDYDAAGHWAAVDAELALQQELLTESQFNDIVESTQQRLSEHGFGEDTMEPQQFTLTFDQTGRNLRLNDRGQYDVTICLDALRAYDYGIISEADYRDTIQRTARRLVRAGFEPLSLSGDHLLLSMDAEGNLRRNRLGFYEVALCNFELIRMNRCPVVTG